MHRIILHLMQQMEKGVLDLTDVISRTLQPWPDPGVCTGTEIMPGKQPQGRKASLALASLLAQPSQRNCREARGSWQPCAAQAACNFLCAAPGPLCRAQPSQGCRDRRELDGPRSSCPAATSPNPLSSFTSSDFLRGPVAQVFGQHFAHVAVLWKQLDHLQASGSCWKGSTEQQDKEQQQMSGHTRFTHGA